MPKERFGAVGGKNGFPFPTRFSGDYEEGLKLQKACGASVFESFRHSNKCKCDTFCHSWELVLFYQPILQMKKPRVRETEFTL